MARKVTPAPWAGRRGGPLAFDLDPPGMAPAHPVVERDDPPRRRGWSSGGRSLPFVAGGQGVREADGFLTVGVAAI